MTFFLKGGKEYKNKKGVLLEDWKITIIYGLSFIQFIRSPDADDCHVIVNDKSTEFILATVVEEASK